MLNVGYTTVFYFPFYKDTAMAKKTVTQIIISYLKKRKTPATFPEIIRLKALKNISDATVRKLLGAEGIPNIATVKVDCPVTHRSRLGYFYENGLTFVS